MATSKRYIITTVRIKTIVFIVYSPPHFTACKESFNEICIWIRLKFLEVGGTIYEQ